jgi:outer membrane protein OmpA-like peptidoglycan-associated protein
LDYSIALSRQRALAVASRLIQRGIAADRLLTYGEGPRDPGQEEGLSRDEERMVEITVRIRNPS